MPKMVGVNDMPKSFDLHPGSIHKKSFGHKRKRIEIPSLPEEIIFKILLSLPADIIYNVMRYVCREWYNIIKDPIFIDAHLQESRAGILVQMCPDRYSTLCVKMGKHGIEISDLNLSRECPRDAEGLSWFWPPSQFLSYMERSSSFRRPEALKFPGEVLASCRGLVLVADMKFESCVHVANLVSKQWVKLPPLEDSSVHAGIAYAASCKEYKVAYTYCYYRDCFLKILTLGVDSAWRCIASNRDMSRSHPGVNLRKLFTTSPHSVGGYIHWVNRYHVFSLEVETERFHVSVAPKDLKYKKHSFLAMESSLCVMDFCGKFIWELWGLREVERGDWTKLMKIDLTAQTPVIAQRFVSSRDVVARMLELDQRFALSSLVLKPLGLLENGELVIFEIFGSVQVEGKTFFEGSKLLVIYNSKTGAIDFLDHDKHGLGRSIRILSSSSPHVMSLVSWKCT